ncbi:hypothetical protein [uncultured Roseobacter sp.]|uniref:hypothetical protein n=1 Tax=uncultured Roseobacter sp. TaxID=114847 RepID=UPI00260E025B|nr:hypothetical protein [uncultured Roseobacter sp.]
MIAQKSKDLDMRLSVDNKEPRMTVGFVTSWLLSAIAGLRPNRVYQVNKPASAKMARFLCDFGPSARNEPVGA